MKRYKMTEMATHPRKKQTQKIAYNRIWSEMLRSCDGDTKKATTWKASLSATHFPGKAKLLTRILNNESQPDVELLHLFASELSMSMSELVVFEKKKNAASAVG